MISIYTAAVINDEKWLFAKIMMSWIFFPEQKGDNL